MMGLHRKPFWLHPDTISSLQRFARGFETQDSVVGRLLAEHSAQERRIKDLEREVDHCRLALQREEEIKSKWEKCPFCGIRIGGKPALRLHKKVCPKREEGKEK